jgi:hypothetical protein
MFKSILTFSVLAGLALSFVCDAWGRSAAPEVRGGRLELAMSSDGETTETARIRLRITGLDHPSNTLVELGESGRSIIDLPAGLYAVDGMPSSSAAGACDVVIPVLGAPALAIVSSGEVSRVLVRAVDRSPESSALAALDASETR